MKLCEIHLIACCMKWVCLCVRKLFLISYACVYVCSHQIFPAMIKNKHRSKSNLEISKLDGIFWVLLNQETKAVIDGSSSHSHVVTLQFIFVKKWR
jgi:inner membrane protein involved in colicin E2 resistance